MLIKELTLNEIKEVYENYMVEAFPKSEIRPFGNIETLYNSGKYFALGGYDQDELKIYAMFCADKLNSACLLDYFATTKSARGIGYGSRFFKELPNIIDGMDLGLVLLEVERIDAAKNESERTTRTRRISFYQQNGCKMSGVKSTVFTDDYNILYLSKEPDIEDGKIFDGISDIYKIIFTPNALKERISVYY